MTETVHAKITGTSARASLSWSADITIEPGSVPDRPMAYSRTGQMYRPASLRLTFSAVAEDPALAGITLPLLAASGVHERITLSSLSITGPRVLSDGRAGKQDHTEQFYSYQKTTPDWAKFLVQDALNTLHSENER